MMFLLACEQSIESIRQENLQRYSPIHSAQNYNPERVRSVSGFIEAIERFEGESTGFRGAPSLSLIIETPDKKHYEVELGPELYVTRQDPHFKLGKEVLVIGDVNEWKKRIIAEKVIMGNTTLKLRDARGVPLWMPSFFRRGSQQVP
jgi:hypothetical protein